MKDKVIVLELAAFSRCFHPECPLEGLVEPRGDSYELLEGGRVVAARLRELATDALAGEAGFGPYRPLLFMAQRAFAVDDADVVMNAAELLGNVFEEITAPAPAI